MTDIVPINRRRSFVDRAKLPMLPELEASIIGGILLDERVLARIPSLEPWHFSDLRCRVAFQVIRNLQAAERPIDLSTLETEIERAGKLEAVTTTFLAEVAMRVPTVENVADYARRVFDAAKLRDLAEEADRTIQRVYDGADEPDEIIAAARTSIERIERAQRAPNPIRLITIPEALAELEVIARAPIYESPFPTLNTAIGMGGFLGTQVYTVAAGTGRGKTTWISAIAKHVAQHTPVLVASWEMMPGYFVARSAAGVLGVHSNAILRGEVDMRLVNKAMPYGRYFMLHRPTLEELRRAVDEIAQRFGQAPLVFVDYLQKLAAFMARTMPRPDMRLATSEASDILLEIASSSRSAVVAVSSIGRGKDKLLSNPRKADPYALVEVAKESGDVEYDGGALMVLTLSSEMDAEEQVATMTVAKARFGISMHIDARYNGARGMWRDVGPAERTSESVKADERLRKKICEALLNGPIASKDALAKACAMRAKDIRTELDAMIAEGEIERVSGAGYALGQAGRTRLGVLT